MVGEGGDAPGWRTEDACSGGTDAVRVLTLTLSLSLSLSLALALALTLTTHRRGRGGSRGRLLHEGRERAAERSQQGHLAKGRVRIRVRVRVRVRVRMRVRAGNQAARK